MLSLQGKKVIVGVSGSIAAYKAAHLVRLLVKQGAEVQVLMTEAATTFITPLTLSTLSKRPVLTSVSSEAGWNNHVELGLWADALVIAPATATTLSKLASGLCDNMVTAVYLSARCPVWIAPAMDLDMWHHPATRRNVQLLQEYGNHLIPVGHGELASGLYGDGRMAEPEDIVSRLMGYWQPFGPLVGRKVLLTAGPTHEPLDPVRFIGNRSSGKMGIALADELARRQAEVVLVLGPTHLRPKHPSVQVIPVQTARQMYEACSAHFEAAQVAIWTAAVADYAPAVAALQKIKKNSAETSLLLHKTVDIAATLGQRRLAGQCLVGFALETENELEHAQAKLHKKNLDLVVLNSLNDAGAGFQYDTNKVTLVYPDGRTVATSLKSKGEVAVDIVNAIEKILIGTNDEQKSTATHSPIGAKSSGK